MIRRALVSTLAVALAACSMAPKTVLPTPPVPQGWPQGDAYLAQSEAGLPVVSYRDIFRDPRLQTLVEQALVNNRDLRVAAANIAAARAQVRVQRANQFPEVAVQAGATRQTTGGPDNDNTRFSVQGGVSAFELDLFGRLASQTRAEQERELGTEAAARTVRLGLVADIAQGWAQHAADAELLAIARATVASASRSVTLTRARLQGGIAPRTDLRQAEQVLAQAEGDVALQTTALAQDVNLLRLLVGAEIDPALLPDSLGPVVASIAVLPAGTSSEVLLRRPDVVEAEYSLRAANADIGAARAALFPRISLTGLFGLASNALGTLFSGGALTTTLGANASYSIFNAGGARAQVAVSEAQRDAALARYEKAIQTAFREVADALATQGTIAARVRAAETRVSAAQDTLRLTDARYRGGISSYLESLDAQRSAYAAQQAGVNARLALVSNRVELYRVLGGDQATALPR